MFFCDKYIKQSKILQIFHFYVFQCPAYLLFFFFSSVTQCITVYIAWLFTVSCSLIFMHALWNISISAIQGIIILTANSDATTKRQRASMIHCRGSKWFHAQQRCLFSIVSIVSAQKQIKNMDGHDCFNNMYYSNYFKNKIGSTLLFMLAPTCGVFQSGLLRASYLLQLFLIWDMLLPSILQSSVI